MSQFLLVLLLLTPVNQSFTFDNIKILEIVESFYAPRQRFKGMAFVDGEFLKRGEASEPFGKFLDAIALGEMQGVEGREVLHAIRKTLELFATHYLEIKERVEVTHVLWQRSHALAMRERQRLEASEVVQQTPVSYAAVDD